MATLTGERIKDTYDGLLKLKDSQALTSSNKVITDGLDNDTALSISSIGVEVNGGTTLNGATEATGEVEVNVTDLANTATEGIRIDLNKNSAGTGYSTKTIALETLANNQGTAQYYATNGIRSVSQHTGTGDGYFLSGVISTTTNEGSGSLAALYGTYTTLNSNGTGVQDVDYMIGNTISMNFNNPNLDVNRVGAINAQLNFNEATTINTEAYVMLLDVDFTGVTGTDIPVGGDFAYLFIKPHTATEIVSTTGSARAINSESTLPSRFAGDMHFEGNVGIGTTSPSAPLNIVNYNPKIVLEDSDNANTFGQIRQQAGNLQLLANNNTSNGTMQFKLDNGTTVTDVMRIDSSGNVGIGTTSPSQKLEVEGNIYTGGSIRITDIGNQLEFGNANVALQRTSNLLELGGYDGIVFKSSNTVLDSQSERMRITSGGNVGIGTTSPQSILHIADANPEFILEDTTNPNKCRIRNNDGALRYEADYNSEFGNSKHQFFVDGTEKLRILSNGNVGIGTTSPSQKLDVSGNINLSGDNRHIYFGGNNTFIGERSNSTELELRGGGNSASQTVYIDNTGQIGVGTSNPSEKLEVVGDAKMTGKLNVGTTTDYADNAAALLAGLVVGDIYRTGDTLKIVH